MVAFRFRPYRDTLDDATQNKMTFKTMEKLKTFVASFYENAFTEDDIIIGDPDFPDEMIGWKHIRYIYVKRFIDEIYDDDKSLCVGIVGKIYSPSIIRKLINEYTRIFHAGIHK
jgi:hypothetical protein